jgi:hypothetical protein
MEADPVSRPGNTPTSISERLQRAIEGGCHMVDELMIESLAQSIQGGRMTWFIGEFAEAIQSGALTPHVWGVLTHTHLDDDDAEQTDKDLRYVWAQVAPGRPYPGDGE